MVEIRKGASWKHPWGLNNSKQPAPHEPVRMVTWNDAYAYANWLVMTYRPNLNGNMQPKVFSKIPILARPMKAIL